MKDVIGVASFSGTDFVCFFFFVFLLLYLFQWQGRFSKFAHCWILFDWKQKEQLKFAQKCKKISCNNDTINVPNWPNIYSQIDTLVLNMILCLWIYNVYKIPELFAMPNKCFLIWHEPIFKCHMRGKKKLRTR